MKTNMITAALCLFSSSSLMLAQVGINTSTPQSTLDINGNMKIRQMPAAASTTGFQVLAVNLNTGGDFEVNRMDPQLIVNLATQGMVTGIPVSVYSARKAAGVTLVTSTTFPTGFQAVNFVNADRNVGSSAIFSDADNMYVVPTTGVYEINYTFRYGNGLFEQAITAGVGIVRVKNSVSTIIDSRRFMNGTIANTATTIAQETLNGLYFFQAGDRICFGLTNSTNLNSTELNESISNFNIAKVSN